MKNNADSNSPANKKKIGILTYHYLTNPGAAIFASSLCRTLREYFPNFDVEILDYRSRDFGLYELLKFAKIHRKVPLFYIRRYLKFQQFGTREFCYSETKLLITSEKKLMKQLTGGDYAAVITAMDVWNISDILYLPKFPNIYWLPSPIQAKKIAYAVSGYRSNETIVKKEMGKINTLLNSFDLVGVRDAYTQDIVKKANLNADVTIEKVPDPTFLYEIKETGVRNVLRQHGIDLNRPILGMLVSGKDKISRQIRKHYKAKGFQIVALSMYNPFVDINLGHILDPYEWAEVFKFFTFCITDRFHGTIFCIKNGIPFISIEPDPLPSLRQSKIFALLKDFELLDCYVDVYDKEFIVEEIFGSGDRMVSDWETKYLPGIDKKISEMKERNLRFLTQIKEVIEG